jgi:hypothetical protein
MTTKMSNSFDRLCVLCQKLNFFLLFVFFSMFETFLLHLIAFLHWLRQIFLTTRNLIAIAIESISFQILQSLVLSFSVSMSFLIVENSQILFRNMMTSCLIFLSNWLTRIQSFFSSAFNRWILMLRWLNRDLL